MKKEQQKLKIVFYKGESILKKVTTTPDEKSVVCFSNGIYIIKSLKKYEFYYYFFKFIREKKFDFS